MRSDNHRRLKQLVPGLFVAPFVDARCSRKERDSDGWKCVHEHLVLLLC